MIHSFKHYVQSHLAVVLSIAALIGFVMPGAEDIPNIIVPVLLGAIIFYSCSKLHMGDLKKVNIKQVIILYVSRFLIAPIILFFIVSAIFPQYQKAFLLLALLPSGVTISAFAAILRGNATLALGALVVTSTLAPFIIPPAFELLIGQSVHIDTFGMFKTLASIIFIPAFLYFAIAKHFKKLNAYITHDASFMSVFMIGFVAVIVVAELKGELLGDPMSVAMAGLVAFLFYAGMYFTGWIAHYRFDFNERLTRAAICGNNNIALGISVALLYFPRDEVLVLIMGEFAWIAGLSLFQIFVEKQRRKQN